ncbi:hypothetical protein K3148_03305 [Qipengyuania aurantiaca]|uniref:Immunity MXAN-0049 protein domain-containing protein n=1 Tax=Qipengyuania aurantiaca TaxID=2867233 RepID=A0ABX8ZS34_9SPHN|nr:DUF1629 domain-containing protein [Qipengyuania aurantiaca]QZD90433.1 hypothetical protein K3148_03305 [Qipengyuania aurantiaca]
MSEVGGARRLFIASPAIGRNVSDFELFDEDRLRREADRSRMAGHVQTGNSFETLFGLPEYAETPRVRVALCNRPLDFYGFDRWILSDRARQLLFEMDPLAFDFVACDTSGPAKHEVGTYWLGKVKRVVTDFDHDASDFERGGWMYDPSLEKEVYVHAITKLNRLTLLRGSEDALAFYLLDFIRYPIFDGRLVDAIWAAKLTGLMFSPLH